MPKFDWLPDKLLDVLGDPHTANNVLKFSGYVTFVSRLVDELVPHCNYLPIATKFMVVVAPEYHEKLLAEKERTMELS